MFPKTVALWIVLPAGCVGAQRNATSSTRGPPLIYSSVTPTSDSTAYDFIGCFGYVRLGQSF